MPTPNIRQHTTISSEPPKHLRSQPMITRKKQQALDEAYEELHNEWYFLDLEAKRVLAGKVIRAVIADPLDWEKERVRLLTTRNVAEDDDPEGEPKKARTTPKRADRAWFPGSEARAIRMANQQRHARDHSPSTPSSLRLVTVVPSIENGDHDDGENPQLGSESDEDTGAGKGNTEKIKSSLDKSLTVPSELPLPPVRRTLFALPTPDTTPAPVQTDEHVSEGDQHANPAEIYEDSSNLKADIDKLHNRVQATKQALEAALLRPDLATSEARQINAKLAVLASRLRALDVNYRIALDTDARLVRESSIEGDAEV